MTTGDSEGWHSADCHGIYSGLSTYSLSPRCMDKDKYEHICPPGALVPWLLATAGESRCGSRARVPRVSQEEGRVDFSFHSFTGKCLGVGLS